MSDHNADQHLLERIRAGDKSACAKCVEQHSPAVYRLALRLHRARLWLRERLSSYFTERALAREEG